MDIVKNPKIDWLGYKWIFFGLSVLLVVGGGVSLLTRGLNLGVDFTGGTLVYAKFKDAPELDRIRTALQELRAEQVSRFDDVSKNEVQIRMARVETDELQVLADQTSMVLEALHKEFNPGQAIEGRVDLSNTTRSGLSEKLLALDPDQLNTDPGNPVTLEAARIQYVALAARIIDFRTDQGGIFRDFAELDGLDISAEAKEKLQENSYLGDFSLLSVESVGPKVGQELQDRAQSAILFSLFGILAYIAFRFRPIYGLAAIIALFHDVFITVGFFSIAYKEISLTVIAALLTLVGYSINDTIVVFDRVRENLMLMRRQDLRTVINTSINQTLNRTILTSGGTFLAVSALYLLGGQVLNGFSFALAVGIIVGTYSSVAIASPIVLWWQNFSERKKAGR